MAADEETEAWKSDSCKVSELESGFEPVLPSHSHTTTTVSFPCHLPPCQDPCKGPLMAPSLLKFLLWFNKSPQALVGEVKPEAPLGLPVS